MSAQRTNVGAIILAAGASTRMGEPKQLLMFEGLSLLRRAVDNALASNCQTVVVVTGANAQRIGEEMQNLPVVIAHNERWNEGMSASVRVGLDVLEQTCGVRVLAAVLMTCDQPHLDSHVINRLIEAHHANGKAIVVSGYDDVWGVPMLFARALWPELQVLKGNEGARSVALRHADNVECVPFALGALDVDTRDDYRRLLSRSSLETS